MSLDGGEVSSPQAIPSSLERSDGASATLAAGQSAEGQGVLSKENLQKKEKQTPGQLRMPSRFIGIRW